MPIHPSIALALILLLAAVLVAYFGACAYLYVYLFVPRRSAWLDDFVFTPWEFQADYEEVELETADGVPFGAWYFRQPGSPQTVVVSPGHKGERQAVLGICILLWRKGFNVITYSYRGMPGSDRRRVTLGIDEVNELQAAIAFARQRVKGARSGAPWRCRRAVDRGFRSRQPVQRPQPPVEGEHRPPHPPARGTCGRG